MGLRRFVLTPVGSAGDVHPFVGVGRVLRQRGHEVVLFTAEPFRAAAERAGLAFHATHSAEALAEAADNPDLWHPQKGLALTLQGIGATLRADLARLGEVFEPGRTVLVGHTLAFATRVFEDQHRPPAATMHIAPVAFRSNREPLVARAIVGLPDVAWWNKSLRWWLADRSLIDPFIVPALNAARRERGLRPVRRPLRAWLHSPQRVVALFPEWFAPAQPGWPSTLRYAGFPQHDDGDGREASPELEAFLGAGPPPILFTPGSSNRHATPFFAAALDAARRLGRRALLLTRYPEQVPDAAPDTAHVARYAPFSQVLRRCAAVVHHGGIGTSAQGLAAGVPQLVTPMGFDQPDNALRLHRLGVADWLLPAAVSGPSLADALQRLLTSAIVANACAECAARLVTEQGAERAALLLEALR